MISAEPMRGATLFDDTAGHGYSIKLDKFEGPMDLLLHLIRKNELDIYDIPIALITRQYLEYLSFLKELNLEVAGDFLVMASTLLQIKSQMLLPDPEPEEGEAEVEEDPRAELVRRLLEYQRYKDAGLHLGHREILGREVFARRFTDPELLSLPVDEGPLELDLFDLAEAFRSLLARIPSSKAHEVTGFETISIADAINDLLSQMQEREMLSFEELFSEDKTRERLIATFLAMLELCRLKLLKVIQNNHCSSIYIYPAVSSEAADGDTGGDTLP